MSSVRLLQNVIETRLSTRGDGTTNNPIRTLVQYWDEHGNFLAELDTFPPNERPSDSESVTGPGSNSR